MVAARDGDLDKLNALIATGVNVEAVDQYGRTAFIYASITSEFEAGKLLLNSGANINAMDNDGRTATHYTVLSRSSKRCRRFLKQLLIKRNADLSVCDLQGLTPLMLCAKSGYFKLISNGRPDLAEMLIDAGVDITYKNTKGWSALMFAAADGNVAVAELLIDSGAWCPTKTEEDLNALLKESNIDFKLNLKALLECSIIKQSGSIGMPQLALNSSVQRVVKRHI